MLRNGLEPWHLLIVAVVFIVLFGARKLPDTARALGKSMRILKSEAQAMKDEGAASTAAADTQVVQPTEVLTSSDVRAAASTATAPGAGAAAGATAH
ncbi:Sec-independent protein translocase subunit TatA [Streptomyces monashensis]|uniref:Sec-independent protein translocase subunit TatA n=1 Tax=Streptomyces monashensis TaxID=1678012 RepID=UPI0033D3D6A4